MMTLEQAINRLEDMVSGNYQIEFPNSELRNNTKDSAELIKFNLKSILKMHSEEVRRSAFDTILRTVLDDTPLPESWQRRGMKTYMDYCASKIKTHRIMKYPDVVEECIDCCEVILTRLNETADTEEMEDRELFEFNRRYYHKYLYFRNNDIGSQYVWVKKIARDEHRHFIVDGTVIYTNGANNTIGLHEVKDFPIENFYCFGDKKNRFTEVADLEAALLSPMDTRIKSHIITIKEAAEDILFIFTWFYEIHMPDMAKVLKTLKFN